MNIRSFYYKKLCWGQGIHGFKKDYEGGNIPSHSYAASMNLGG